MPPVCAMSHTSRPDRFAHVRARCFHFFGHVQTDPHAWPTTADPKFLLTVGNHFYKDTKDPAGTGKPSEWKLLKMTRESLAAKNIDLKFEWPSPVGDKEEMSADQSGGERFPHIYGGIPTDGVVIQEFDITRDVDGTFTGIVW